MKIGSVLVGLLLAQLDVGRSELRSSVQDDIKDPNLHLMEYDIGTKLLDC